MKIFYITLAVIFILTSCYQKPSDSACDVSNKYGYDVRIIHGYVAHHNLNSALECSKESDKPILMMFICWACMWNSDAPWWIMENDKTRELITKHYVLTTLYVDERTKLKIWEKNRKDLRGRLIENVGQRNSNIQVQLTNNNTVPSYVIVDTNLNVLSDLIGYIPAKNKKEFDEFLDERIKNNKLEY
ncbi:MAG: hypothetical protein IIA45_00860 [Bacteroidetes bacterium]|nr:hypothetical protein [Bacteroidota bacterium]